MSTKKNQSVPKDQLVELYRQALLNGVPLDKIDDKVKSYVSRSTSSAQVEQKVDQTLVQKTKRELPAGVRVLSALLPMAFLGVGLALVSTAVVPIASYFVTNAQLLALGPMKAPIPQEDVLEQAPQVITQAAPGVQLAQATGPSEPKMLNIELDYTNLSNWFTTPPAELAADSSQAPVTYFVDIPSLNIEQAEVRVGGTDLNNSIIQYPGTAKPGEFGSPVIFGHSVLRQFYNPKISNPKRYNSIFSTIMTMKPGELIYVTHDGVKYTYRVRTKTEVKPEDTYILAQRNDAKLIKLVTCTPEGTKLRRGVVTAELVE